MVSHIFTLRAATANCFRARVQTTYASGEDLVRSQSFDVIVDQVDQHYIARAIAKCHLKGLPDGPGEWMSLVESDQQSTPVAAYLKAYGVSSKKWGLRVDDESTDSISSVADQ